MKSSRGKIGVIGAGLGGLSAALDLSSRGFDVEVYERLDSPGGKASERRMGDYRFDMGPSLLTLPEVFSNLLNIAGERLEDHLEFCRLDPITRYFFPDGTILNAWANRERFADEVEEKLGEPAGEVISYLDKCMKTYKATTPLFMFKPLHEMGTLLSLETVEALFRTPKRDAFRTMHDANRGHFRDKRTVQLFDRYATYNGSSPYMTPAMFNLIQHVEYGIGGFAVKGGIHRIPKILERLCKGKGVVFNYGSEVGMINIENGRVSGLIIDGRFRKFDAVVCNSDVTSSYSNLLHDSGSSEARRYRSMEPSSSGRVFLWGINRGKADLGVNNIFFSDDYRKEFDDIWKKRISPSDPTVYINITSRIDHEDAPQGCENWFVLVNVPYNSGQDWNREREMTREHVMERVNRTLGIDTESMIEVEDHLGPVEIEERYGGNRGSIYGVSSNDKNSAFLRQPNRSRTYGGLYFAGGSAHPGGGMPLVILSGRHAASLISSRLN